MLGCCFRTGFQESSLVEWLNSGISNECESGDGGPGSNRGAEFRRLCLHRTGLKSTVIRSHMSELVCPPCRRNIEDGRRLQYRRYVFKEAVPILGTVSSSEAAEEFLLRKTRVSSCTLYAWRPHPTKRDPCYMGVVRDSAHIVVSSFPGDGPPGTRDGSDLRRGCGGRLRGSIGKRVFRLESSGTRAGAISSSASRIPTVTVCVLRRTRTR